MSNFINLTKVQVLTLFPKGKKQKRSMFLLGLLYFALAIFIALYSVMFSVVFCMMDATSIIPAFFYTITSIVILVTTVLKTSGLLFNNRDYELLTALPIKTSTLIASRLTAIYLVNFFFGVSIMAPALIPIIFVAKPGVLFCILYLLSMFVVPLFPLAISTFIGIVVSFVASRFRHKSIVTIILSFGALFAVLYFSMTLSNVSEEAIESFGDAFMNLASTFYPPSILYNMAFNVEGMNLLYFVFFVLLSVGSMGITIAVLAPLYKKIYTALNARSAKANYVYKTTKSSSPFMAIYKKELRRYFGCTAYVVNTAFSPLMVLVLAIASCFVPIGDIIQTEAAGLGDMSSFIARSIPYIAGLVLCMAPTTASVISLEGKALWITQTLPIPQHINMNAKMLVNITLTAPVALISSVIFKFSLDLSILDALVCFIVMMALIMLSTAFGLLLNILAPNFNWVNEAAVVKQSMPVFVAMFAMMILAVGCMIVALVIPLPYNITNLGIAMCLMLLGALFAFLCYRLKIKE